MKNSSDFWKKNLTWLHVAAMAVGVLLVSTAFRMWGVGKRNRANKSRRA